MLIAKLISGQFMISLIIKIYFYLCDLANYARNSFRWKNSIDTHTNIVHLFICKCLLYDNVSGHVLHVEYPDTMPDFVIPHTTGVYCPTRCWRESITEHHNDVVVHILHADDI